MNYHLKIITAKVMEKWYNILKFHCGIQWYLIVQKPTIFELN